MKAIKNYPKDDDASPSNLQHSYPITRSCLPFLCGIPSASRAALPWLSSWNIAMTSPRIRDLPQFNTSFAIPEQRNTSFLESGLQYCLRNLLN